jgi:hypothetical protein
MKKLQKLFLAFVLVTIALGAPAPAVATCDPVAIAESTACVEDQITPLRDSGFYNETVTVIDNGNGTYTVEFVFDPKCRKLRPPCGAPSRIVTATVNCATGTATCP